MDLLKHRPDPDEAARIMGQIPDFVGLSNYCAEVWAATLMRNKGAVNSPVFQAYTCMASIFVAGYITGVRKMRRGIICVTLNLQCEWRRRVVLATLCA